MKSTNGLNTIFKYKLIVICGLLVMLVLVGAGETGPARQDEPGHREQVLPDDTGLKEEIPSFNENNPVNFLEFED